MAKIITAMQAAEIIKEGMTIMVGGFLAAGTPETIINALVTQGTQNLTLIGNDTAFTDRGIGKLILNKQIKHVIASHIGTNKETGNQMNTGTTKVTLVPQGTLAEQIRAAGSGLGGILTPTGVGTPVAEGKQLLEIKNKTYLLEESLGAEIAIIKAYKADKKGNLVYRYMARNFNPIMAMAAPIVIAEVEQIVEIGEIQPDEIITPAVFIDYIVQSEVNA